MKNTFSYFSVRNFRQIIVSLMVILCKPVPCRQRQMSNFIATRSVLGCACALVCVSSMILNCEVVRHALRCSTKAFRMAAGH